MMTNQQSISPLYEFQPVADETRGPMDEATISFIRELYSRSVVIARLRQCALHLTHRSLVPPTLAQNQVSAVAN